MQAKQNISRASVYEIVTESIIKQLESGVAPWRKSWRCEPPCNLISGKPYRGLNPFLLVPQGYGSKYWLTFAQANKIGGHIRKGEKSSIVVFWRVGEEKIITSPDGVTHNSKPFLLRYYRVFNVEQTVGIADKLGLGNATPRVASIEQCETIVNDMQNAPRREPSDRAWYRPSTDSIGMPSRDLFNSSEEFYSTLFHEMSHSTGHASRVGREGIEQLNAFGSESYSKEELIAEMGAAMLCGVGGISPATIPNSAAYLQSWINRLRGDSRLLVSAASAAQRSTDYILSTSAKSEEVSEGGAL